MLKNYLISSIRNLVKNKSYTLINIAGLAIGIACSIYIALYIMHELSYDKFHPNAKQIYRVGVKGQFSGSVLNQAVTAAPMAQALKNDLPEVIQATRFREYGDWLIKYKEKRFHETRFLFADSNFFEMFHFPLLRGDSKTALTNPRSVILTESTAKKYFGSEDPMGKMLRVESDTVFYQVTGIMKDVPQNSHFTFDMLGALTTFDNSRRTTWVSHNFYTYIQVQENFPVDRLTEDINTFIEKYVGPQIEELLGITLEQFSEAGNEFGYFVQPLLDIHLHSDLQYEFQPQGNMLYVTVFSIVAIMILVIACINFMNLATARSANRAKEIGIRKVAGSGKAHLYSQFLIESVILSFVATLFAILLVELFKSAYHNLINLQLSIPYLSTWYIIPSLLVLSIFVGFMAGSYPAFVLTSFNPVATLKGKVSKGAKSGLLRSILVVFQFGVSILILLGTLTVYQQVNYMQNKDMGFDKQNMVIIRRSDVLEDQIETFKQEIKKHPNILAASHSNTIPGRNFSNNAFWVEGQSTADTKLLWQGWVSKEFQEVFQFEMKEGRFFTSDSSSDSLGVVINEAAVKYLNLDQPVGTRFFWPGNNSDEITYYTITGVVKDFHFQELKEQIHPMVLSYIPGNWEGYISIRVLPGKLQETLRFIEEKWLNFSQEYPIDYFLFEEDYNKLYKSEMQTGNIFFTFSILSIIIACLGLFGLVSYTTSQRTKEIGIRKALGSSVPAVVGLISKETLRLVFIAFLIVCPIAYFIIKNWLQNFAYHIDISIMVFAIVLLVILIIALLTVIFQAINAARKNPAHSLRYE